MVHNEDCPIGVHAPDECTCNPNPFKKKTAVEDVNPTLGTGEGVIADAVSGTVTPHHPGPNSITAPIHDPVSSGMVFTIQVLNWGVRAYRKIRNIGD